METLSLFLMIKKITRLYSVSFLSCGAVLSTVETAAVVCKAGCYFLDVKCKLLICDQNCTFELNSFVQEYILYI